MKKILLIIILFVFTTTAFAQDTEKFRVIEPAEFKKEIQKKDVQLIDVRTPEEYAAGHIEGAHNIDFLAEGFLKHFENFDKNKPVYLYCRSGNRSAKASAQLIEAGFKNIIDLKGGYKAWPPKNKD
ncbi:rhodanese-like domain-containing protein [Salinimicrobium soli]|uniref:rhodanese-like domain-containing protein n=1 Tax=Salinimicrobium soli TaxID=1254399 RepID=UPI003AADC2C6